MLSPGSDTVRLSLHVAAAAVWLGGNMVWWQLRSVVRGTDLAGRLDRVATRTVWPAFVVLVATGFWSITDLEVGGSTFEFQLTLFIKIVVSLLSAVALGSQLLARRPAWSAGLGASGIVLSVIAVVVGVLLRTGR